jgi:hypothetical protein
MYGRITIDTRGVKGAGLLLKEFTSGLAGKLSPVMLETARQLRSEMQARAPVRTGYMRNHITEMQLSPLTVRIISMAPYSGFVNYGQGTNAHKGPRPFFTGIVDTMGPQAFTERFAQESVVFLNQLISKYQRGP